jgi:hypothetical protein
MVPRSGVAFFSPRAGLLGKRRRFPVPCEGRRPGVQFQFQFHFFLPSKKPRTKGLGGGFVFVWKGVCGLCGVFELPLLRTEN